MTEAPESTVTNSNFFFSLCMCVVDGKTHLHVNAEPAGRELSHVTFHASFDDVECRSLTQGLCSNATELLRAVEMALKGESGWTVVVTPDRAEEAARRLKLVIRHDLGFTHKEFELALQAQELGVPERLDRMERNVRPRSGDVITRHHAQIQLFHEGLGASVLHGTGAAHRCFSTGVLYTRGQHYAEWRFLRCASNYCVGVLEQLDQMAGYPGAGLTGHSLFGVSGHRYSSGGPSGDYGLGTFGPGEYVGVLLDMDAKTVTFSINGREGAAVPLTGNGYYFYASLYNACDAVELLPEYCWHSST